MCYSKQEIPILIQCWSNKIERMLQESSKINEVGSDFSLNYIVRLFT